MEEYIMKAIHFTPGCEYLNDAFKVVEIEDELDIYYDMIDCNTIDIVTIRFNGIDVDVIVDDNGLLVDKPIPSVVNESMSIYIAGKILITGTGDNEGRLTSISDSTINIIKDTARLVLTENKKTGERKNMVCLIADELE